MSWQNEIAQSRCVLICALALSSIGTFRGTHAATSAEHPVGAGVEEACEIDAPIDFQRDIRPILEKCSTCHGGVKKTAGLSVVSRKLLLDDTDSGKPCVIPGDAAGSELIRRVSSDDADERMPPDEPLSQMEVQLLRRWINAGASWPEHWAYRALARKTLPSGTTNPIDYFVLKRLSQAGIWPSIRADRPTLIRRLSLDLTGLLPSTREVGVFVGDRSATAYDDLVNRLLASEHYGERWARHWLDEARYADSEGYEKDPVKNDAYLFRDWVIHAINDDMPFDNFTRKQIAGDLLPNRTNDDLVATKLHLQAQFNLEGGVDSEEDRTKRVIDRTNMVGTVWLATTIGCCQCHDHPYDPISQGDYYAFYAFFNNLDLAADFLENPPDDAGGRRQKRMEKWNEIVDMSRRQVTDKNLNFELQEKLNDLRRFDNDLGFTRYLVERTVDRRKTYVFRRGNFLRPLLDEGEVSPVAPRLWPSMKPASDEASRLDLANWLTAEAAPIVARVRVNRVWMHLFGKPLAVQTIDFGSRGDMPSHPELLDWLADWFIHDAGWSRKELIRLIVSSETYCQSSDTRPDIAQIDADNQLLWRQNRHRVEAEILRDIALDVSGLLCRKVRGRSVRPPIPAHVAQQSFVSNPGPPISKGKDRYRRGLYTLCRRTAIDPNLLTFDCPDASVAAPRRQRSNNALQALATLQNEVFLEAAQGFAKRLVGLDVDLDRTDQHRLGLAIQMALSRNPEPFEMSTLADLLTDSRSFYQSHSEEAVRLVGAHRAEGVDPAENASWVVVARAILNLDEFITRQ
jgi:hypothetical protein